MKWKTEAFAKRTAENDEHLSQGSQQSGRESNRAPFEYKSEELLLEPTLFSSFVKGQGLRTVADRRKNG
jgi:hypothetical protein